MTCLGALCRCQESIAVMVMCQMIHCLVANESECRLVQECMRRTGKGAGLEACAAPEDHHAEQSCPHDRRWNLWDAQPRFESRGCGLPGPMKHCAKQMQLRSFRFLPPWSTTQLEVNYIAMEVNCEIVWTYLLHGARLLAHELRRCKRPAISSQRKTANHRLGPTMRLWQTRQW